MESDKYMKCNMCGGSGNARCPECSGSGDSGKCPFCDGDGYAKCPECEGYGIVLRPEFR